MVVVVMVVVERERGELRDTLLVSEDSRTSDQGPQTKAVCWTRRSEVETSMGVDPVPSCWEGADGKLSLGGEARA